MHGTQIRQQGHSLPWIVDQLSRRFKLFNGLGQFSLLAQHRAEPPEGLIVFWVKQPCFVESSHGCVQGALSNTRPSLFRQSAARSLPVTKSKGGVPNQVLVVFLQALRSSDCRLTVHRQFIARITLSGDPTHSEKCQRYGEQKQKQKTPISLLLRSFIPHEVISGFLLASS